MSTLDFLTVDDLILRYRGLISHGTLANWRSLGQGPAYFKAGKMVLYPVDKLRLWEEKNMKITASAKAGKDGRGMASST